jgi:hypothetical protein
MKDSALMDQALPTQRAAERVAKLMGCSGAHRTADGWFPCESPRKLRALLNGGVSEYRKIKSIDEQEIKLLGAVLNAVRGSTHVDTHPGDHGRPVRKRRVPLDPKARDADGDGLIQEGTTAERNARSAAKPVGVAKRTAGVTAATARTRRAANVKPIKPGKGKPDLPEPVRPSIPLTGAQKAQHTILHDRIKAKGGLGAPRTREQGPLPRVATRGKIIHSRLERRFGKLETLDDYDKALKKTFPNARFDGLAIAVKPAEEGESIAAYSIGRRFSNEDDLAAFYDPRRPDEIKKSIMGFYDAILESGLNDEKSANKVGRVSLAPGKSNFQAMVGPSATNPVDHPITIHLNPKAMRDQADLSDGDNVLAATMTRLHQLTARDDIKKKGEGGTSSGNELSDGDAGLLAMQTGFHEWSHVAGLSRSLDSIAPEDIDALKEWTRTGGDFPDFAKNGFGTPELFTQWADVMGQLGADDSGKATLQRISRSMGFENIDLADQEALSRMWRAYASRIAISYRSSDIWNERVEQMSDRDWERMDTVSGYANSSKEEALAELHGLYHMYPEHAATKYRRAVAHPEFVRRLA